MRADDCHVQKVLSSLDVLHTRTGGSGDELMLGSNDTAYRTGNLSMQLLSAIMFVAHCF